MSDTWKHEDTESEKHPQEDGRRADNCADISKGLASGSGLGKYRILERIRSTHNAIAYKARDTMLDRLVTVKQMNPHLIDDPIGCGEFKREAQLLARIPKDARNVVNIHELIEGEQGLFIVEEYIPGNALKTLISKRQVDATDAVRLLKAGCTGLQTLHFRRIVHRDIRPENLLVTKSGQVHILNLSCSAHEGDDSPPPIIAPKYAAPELQAEQDHDARVDIYAFGFVIYEVCVGRRALNKHFADLWGDAEFTEERWRKWHTNMEENLPDATSLNPTVPQAMSLILRRMTSKNLDDRFTSVQEILEELAGQFKIQKSKTPSPPPAEQASNILDLRSTASGVVQLITRPKPLSWFPNHDQSTSKHVVEPSGIQDQTTAPVRPFYRDIDWPKNRVSHRAFQRSASFSSPCPVPALPVLPPVDVEETPRRKHWRPLLPAAVCVLALIMIFLVTPSLWDRFVHEPEVLAVKKVLDEARGAYSSGDFQSAAEKYQEVEILCFGESELTAERKDAKLMLLLIKGHRALDENKFIAVEKIIEVAENRGANKAALDELRDAYWSRKDAYRLAAEGDEELKRKRFSSVEMKLDEYEEKAIASGLDPLTLKEKLEQTKKDAKYNEALERSRKALKQKDFESALIACRNADSIKSTSDTRQLFTDIQFAKDREEWIMRGDQAMLDQDHAAAESAYKSANEIEPSDDVERKVRVAASLRLVQEAREAINKGDLLAGKRLLENSMWKHPNAVAQAMLERMNSAFEAASLVKKADRRMAKGDYSEAIRLYQEALPRLPAVSKQAVQEKLADARKATTQPIN
ncbi:MAG: protein kinase [Phycisphaerales bacterium]|nr:protein kinase [Phycisphaerales bacterium]